MKKINLSLSKEHEENYLASVCKIKEVFPIEGSDFLAKTVIDGFTMVIPITMKTGDIVIYSMIESALNKDYLSANNLYEMGCYHLNENHKIVNDLLEAGKKDEAKRLVGFFNEHGRVKTITLRGTPSQGFVCEFDSIKKWMKDLDTSNAEDLVGKTFDTINGELFIKKYIPRTKKGRNGSYGKYEKKIGKFDRMIPNQFHFHYDTAMFNKYYTKVQPDSLIHISVKKHGTSLISSKLLTRAKLTFMQKIKKLFGCKVNNIEYGSIYSSRSVIRNKYGYNNQVDTFSGVDVYSAANKILYPLLSNGMTVYCELFGYVPDTTKFIQKGYDYGCRNGEYITMPYRITTTDEKGVVFEWKVDEVIDWTNKQLSEHNELIGKLMPLETIYKGLARDLYPNIPIDDKWSDNFLEALKNDKNMFMEMNDPTCKNKVPFEGIVIKLADSRESQAFKLKCQAFYMREQKAVDKGEIDMETEEKL